MKRQSCISLVELCLACATGPRFIWSLELQINLSRRGKRKKKICHFICNKMVLILKGKWGEKHWWEYSQTLLVGMENYSCDDYSKSWTQNKIQQLHSYIQTENWRGTQIETVVVKATVCTIAQRQKKNKKKTLKCPSTKEKDNRMQYVPAYHIEYYSAIKSNDGTCHNTDESSQH